MFRVTGRPGWWFTLFACAAASCGGDDASSRPAAQPSAEPRKVVLYTSLNEPTARTVVSAFEKDSGIRVQVVSDTERDKTVGLVQTLIAEKPHPRADVFWNSETAHTVRLKNEGVLAKCDPPPEAASRIPERYRDRDGVWFGFAARARVLIVNTDLVPAESMPKSMWDLADPKWKGRTAMARPVTGTTLTQVTALHRILGGSKTLEFLGAVRANDVNLPPGNGRVASLVGEGAVAFGLTDTSDYRLVKAEGKPVTAVYPDQDGIGTLVLPNTAALVAGGPHPRNGRKLLEFLLSDEAERMLAHHPRGHIPLKPGIDRPSEVKVPGEFKEMQADYEALGADVAQRLREMNELFK